jgi:hypothetical protein
MATMKANRSRRRAPGLESLEGRWLLAGNVTAAVNGGVLTLTGDPQANQLTVYQTAPGTYHVVGEPGTTINGRPDVTVRGITAGVNVNLGDGDDYLALMAVVPGDLNINLGSGDDTLSLGGFFELPPDAQPLPWSVDVAGKLSIDAGSGNDSVQVLNSRVAGAVNLQGGSGANGFTLFQSRFLQSLALNAGSGDDSVELNTITVLGATTAAGGSGNDSFTVVDSSFASLTLDGGSGTGDSLTFAHNVAGKTSIKGFEQYL